MSQELASRLRAFLMKHPRPDIVRVTTASGETKEVHLDEGGRVRWSDVGRTVADLDPAVVQALNVNEEVLRVEKIVEGAEPSPRQFDISDPMAHPPLPAGADSQTIILHHFSTLIAHAHKFATQVGFDAVNAQQEREARRHELTEQRLERIERAYKSEFEARVRERLETMEEGDSKDRFLEAFFTGKNNAQAETAAETPANGKSRHSSSWGGEN